MSKEIYPCGDCLNPCDTWEYEYGKPNCKERQNPNPTSKWGFDVERPCITLREMYVQADKDRKELWKEIEHSKAQLKILRYLVRSQRSRVEGD